MTLPGLQGVLQAVERAHEGNTAVREAAAAAVRQAEKMLPAAAEPSSPPPPATGEGK